MSLLRLVPNDAELRYLWEGDLLRKHIADQVRITRESRGLTQADLARLMGTKQSAVSNIENHSKVFPTLNTLRKVAVALDCALIIEFVTFSDFIQIIIAGPKAIPPFHTNEVTK